MEADQLFYTSSIFGELGSHGFQVCDKSNDFFAQEIKNIISRINYTRPKGLPSLPDKKNIERDYPVAMRCCLLPSGRYMLALISYTGAGEHLPKNSLARGGNFFAHVICFQKLPFGLWPIDLLGWQGWKKELLPDEDIPRTSPSLKMVKLNKIIAIDKYNLKNLSEFLNQKSNRKEILQLMIQCIIQIKEPSNTGIQQILIMDTNQNNFYWIACLQKVFPQKCMKNLSFSTYNFNEQDFQGDIIATVKGSGYKFSPREMDFIYYTFNFEEDKFGNSVIEIQSKNSNYAHCIANWLTSDLNSLVNFYKFFDNFNIEKPDYNLENILNLYNHIFKQNFIRNANDLLSALDMINTLAENNSKDDLLSLVLNVAVSIFEKKDLNQKISFIQQIVEKNKNNERGLFKSFILKNWISIFIESINMDNSTFNTVVSIAENIKKKDEYNYALAVLLKKKSTIDSIWPFMNEVKADRQSAILNFFIQYTKKKTENYWLQSFIKKIIILILKKNKLSPEIIEGILNCFFESAEAFIYALEVMIKYIDEHFEQNKNLYCIIGRSIHKILISKDVKNFVEKIRLNIAQNNWHDIAFFEYIEAFNNSPSEHLKYFLTYHKPIYCNILFDKEPQKFIFLYKDYLSIQNSEKEILNFFIIFFKTNIFFKLSKNDQNNILKNVNETFKLYSKGLHSIVRQLDQNGFDFNYDMSLERIMLVKKIIFSGYESLEKMDFGHLRSKIEYLSIEEIDYFLKFIITNHLSKVKNGMQHGEILKKLLIIYNSSDLQKSYIKWISKQHSCHTSLKNALKFWLFIFKNNQEDFTSLYYMKNKSIEKLCKVITKIDKISIKNIKYDLVKNQCEENIDAYDWDLLMKMSGKIGKKTIKGKFKSFMLKLRKKVS